MSNQSELSNEINLFNQVSLMCANYTVDSPPNVSVSRSPDSVCVPALFEPKKYPDHKYPHTVEEWKVHFDAFEHRKNNSQNDMALMRAEMRESYDRDEGHMWTGFNERPRVEIVEDSVDLFMMNASGGSCSPYIALTNVFGHSKGTETELYAQFMNAREFLSTELAANQEKFPDANLHNGIAKDPRRVNAAFFNCENIEQIASMLAEKLQAVPIVYKRLILAKVAEAVKRTNELPDSDRFGGISMLCQNKFELAYFCIVSIYSLEIRGTNCERYSVPCKREFEFVQNLIKSPINTLLQLMTSEPMSATPVPRDTKLFVLKKQVLPTLPSQNFCVDTSVHWTNDCDYSRTLMLSIVEIYLCWAVALSNDLRVDGGSVWFRDPAIQLRIREFFRTPERVQRFIAYLSPRFGYIAQYASNMKW